MAIAQMPTNGDYSNWNWEDQSQNNWLCKYDNNWIDISPPFAPTTERLGSLMVSIYETDDYTKAKGWNLVWAQFDSDYPWFALYNQHKSIIRVFFLLERIPYSDILATLSFTDINNPGILSYADEYQTSTEDYYNNNANYDNDLIAVILRNNVSPKNWGAADFPILYDNNIMASKYTQKKWEFRYYGCDNYNISFDGETSADPALLNDQQTILAKKTSVSGITFDAAITKLNTGMISTDKFLQSFKNSVKGIDSNSPQFLQDYKAIIEKTNDLSGVVSAAVPWVSAVVGFVKIIIGCFSDEESTVPVASVEHLKLKGTMTIRQPLGGNTFSIPGVSGNYFPQGLLWQPFDCPMGIINLQKTPTIKMTSSYFKYGFYDPNMTYGYKDGKLKYIYDLAGYPSPIVVPNEQEVMTSYAQKYPGKFKKYQFDSDIILTQQYLDGLQLEEVNFAIVCKANGIGSRKYEIYDKYLAYHKFYDLSSREVAVPVENPVYKALIEKRFIIHKFDTERNEIYFGTPYMSKNKLKGLVIEVPEDTDVKLAVFARFTSDIYSEPIIFKAMYNINFTPVVPLMNNVYFGQEQSSLPFSDFYNTPLYRCYNLTDNQPHSAALIEMTTGFVGNPGFVAEALPQTKGLENGNTVINVNNFGCIPSLKSTKPDKINYDFSEGLEFKPVIYPNPSSGRISIFVDHKIPDSIIIYNSSGEPVVVMKKVYRNKVDIDLSKFSSAYINKNRS